jgi:undecaprenyl diphosphate synthase
MENTLPPGTKVPNHLLIIPDGNRRWAKAHGLPSFEGHRRGAEISHPIAKACRNFGIHTLTMWAFSTKNWKRSNKETGYLMRLSEEFINRHLEEAQKEEVKIIHLGRKDRLPKSLKRAIENAEEKTRQFKKYIFNLALDYEGRDEILRAIKELLQDFKRKEFKEKEVSEELLTQYLDTANQPHPYPDLLIRTSGEQRTSGIFVWQATDTELYFEESHFPDFSVEKLKKALLDYSQRERRLGGN